MKKTVLAFLIAVPAFLYAAGPRLIAGYVSEEPGLERKLKGAKIKISCSRPSAEYRCGEVADFEIRPVDAEGNAMTSAVVRVRVDNFGEHVVVPEYSVVPGPGGVLKTSGTLLKPGFLRVYACMQKGETKVESSWSVAYEPEKIMPGTPDASDFDDFWRNACERLEKEVPLDMKCSKVEELSRGDRDFYVFDFNTWGGKRLNGSLTVPKKLKPPYPVRIRMPGAGCGAGANRITTLMPFDDALCMMVYPFEWKQAITGSLDKVMAKYDAFWGECEKKYSVPWYCAGISVSREDFFYFPVILGANRAINWLRSSECPFPVDHDDFIYAGASQGGGLGLALLYLNGNFRKGVIHVPGITDMLGFYEQSRKCGWPAAVMAHDACHRAAVADRLRYFDGVNFARRLKTPVLFTAGYADTACSPASVRATFNVCSSESKEFFGMIGIGHTVTREIDEKAEKWLKEK